MLHLDKLNAKEEKSYVDDAHLVIPNSTIQQSCYVPFQLCNEHMCYPLSTHDLGEKHILTHIWHKGCLLLKVADYIG
jgi:hypothetical protein